MKKKRYIEIRNVVKNYCITYYHNLDCNEIFYNFISSQDDGVDSARFGNHSWDNQQEKPS